MAPTPNQRLLPKRWHRAVACGEDTRSEAQLPESGSKQGRSLASCDRGAVMLESVMTIPVLLWFFAMVVQYSYLAMAALVVQHAAVYAARSASVIVPDDPTAFKDNSPPGSLEGDRKQTIQDATAKLFDAIVPLPMMGKQSTDIELELEDVQLEAHDGDEVSPEDCIKATVSYDFKCQVIFGGSLICGVGSDPSMKLQNSAIMPSQGAFYGYF